MDISQKIKALGHPVRLKIVELLMQKKMCVRSLARHFEVSEPTVSVHLKVLKKAGLIIGEKKSYYMHYRVVRENINELAEFFHYLAATPELEQNCCHKSANCHCKCHTKKDKSI
ncbi:MAG: winged helix-turn-helix transcriptional regulator [Lentisphaeria bacterium]|nr:winged helix-turn-helix transcriptional regulator [Lentisphaeria bacterium]